jgi:CRP/FNR family transcriptional regulator, cyclic AMP receptor protein
MLGPRATPHDALDSFAASESLRELACRGTRHIYRKGVLIIQEGDLGDTIYIILSGRLRVFSSKANGDREFTLGSYGPGEYVGEMGLDGGPRSASVITLEKSECSVIARPTLEAFIAERPAFAFELIDKLIRRARAATLSATRMALNDVYGRLKLLLEAMVRTDAEGTRTVTERLTQLELANRVGCTREMVGRVIRELERGGYLEVLPQGLVLRRALPARW